MRTQTDTNATTPRALSIATFCQTYDVSRAHTYKLIECGDITAVKMGSRTLIPVESAEAWFSALPKIPNRAGA